MSEGEGDGAARVWTVSRLTQAVRGLLEEGVGRIWVEGEVSNHRRQASGHQYFTLKDEGAQVACVWFRGRAMRGVGGIELADGQQVQVYGLVTVYAARGQYQISVEMAQPRGAGALQARFEALKRKLDAEGLFDPGRKRALPRFPVRVGVVTSPTGAAIRDLLTVMRRRAPWVEILISPARVQGEGAAPEIAAAIAVLNGWASNGLPRVDVIVLARGGGSIEDLWAFNEEEVARAIHASEIPVVSAVGHETDFTIADFVADLRAPTPSAAAELVVPEGMQLLERLRQIEGKLAARVRSELGRLAEVLRLQVRGTLQREPARRIEENRQRLDQAAASVEGAASLVLERRRSGVRDLSARLERFRPDLVFARMREAIRWMERGLRGRVERAVGELRGRHREAGSMLRLLGPQATLERGYTITQDEAGKILRGAGEASSGSVLQTRFRDGEVRSKVEP